MIVAHVVWRDGDYLAIGDILRFNPDVTPQKARETARKLYPARDYPDVAFIVYSSEG